MRACIGKLENGRKCPEAAMDSSNYCPAHHQAFLAVRREGGGGRGIQVQQQQQQQQDQQQQQQQQQQQ